MAIAMNGHQPQAAIMQFLNSMLSQGGPGALPYEESSKWSIRQQLCAVMQEFPTLELKPESFIFNDGRSAKLLRLLGTIPMYYQSATYNIPVKLWLLDGFPKTPPLFYVVPTQDMIIQARHPFVDASGLVNVPYLREWLFPRSNLVELVQVCSSMFGFEPPLYASTAKVQPVYASTAKAQPVYQNVYQKPPPPQEDPETIFRRKAINTLTEKLQQDIQRLNKDTLQDLEQQISNQQLLNQRAEAIDRGLRELNREKEALEHQLQVMLTNADVLEDWLKANDRETVELDIDAAFEPADVLSMQMLEASCADLAIEDILYSLEKAVQEDDNERRLLSVEMYLRHIRALSRDQFMHRLMKVKAQQALNHAYVAAMAMRAPSQGR